MVRRRLVRILKLLLTSVLFVILTAPEWPAFGDEAYQLDTIVGLRQFDFLVWEMNAIRVKVEAMLTNGHSYLDRETREGIVVDYLQKLAEIGQLQHQIDVYYADPESAEPEVVSKELQLELAQKRERVRLIQPMAEAIVQDQVADILTRAEFDLLGQAWPPVMMHMTPLPSILIVSPRDRIERIYGIPLLHGLTTPVKEELETAVYDRLDFSALVVPIGGLGVYPSMISETSNINWLTEVTAHEWAHHWLGPHAISLYYASDSQVRTMNETVASIVGTEVGATVIEKHYPEYAPPDAEEQVSGLDSMTEMPSVPVFDFQAEMAQTRAEVDKLLADDLVEEAEAYMEERREFFWENGYPIRKLNQAYFAFYGAYADEPGATGEDPIGPMLLEIRARSASLRDFMQLVAPIGNFEELSALLDRLKAADE
jgi:hypothetical protein